MIGSLSTPCGILRLPAFFPDATRAVIRSLDSKDVEDCGIEGVVVNTFHLLSKPGVRVISSQGGIHKFMNWRGHIISDSGGFQLFSLLANSSKPLMRGASTPHSRRPEFGTVSKKGFVYRLNKGEDKKILTPEKCIQKQFQFASDIMVCLDYCTHPADSYDKQKEGVEYTVLWAGKCRSVFDKLLCEKEIPAYAGTSSERPLLFAVVQGGSHFDLRRECAERLIEMGFDGYGYGGWPIVEGNQLADTLELVSQILPTSKPKYALGIGKPENIVKCVNMGYDLFDCVIPTRDARHRRLYVFSEKPESSPLSGSDFYKYLYLQDKKHINDKRPLEEDCDCLCCRSGYSRAYLYHLFQIEDALAYRLATIHNLRFYARLMEAIRRQATSRRLYNESR